MAQDSTETTNKPLPLRDPGGHLGIYADVFSVVGEAETGMYTITFYQTEVPSNAFSLGTSAVGTAKDFNFVSRVVLSSKGVAALVSALQQNQQEQHPPQEGP